VTSWTEASRYQDVDALLLTGVSHNAARCTFYAPGTDVDPRIIERDEATKGLGHPE